MEAPNAKIDKWKEKAVKRSKEIKSLRKRISELHQSRDKWKQKALESKCRRAGLRARGNQISDCFKGDCPHGHSYSATLIALLVMVRVNTGAGLRSCCKTIGLLFFYLEVQVKVPSYNSVNNWSKKIGLYYLLQDQQDVKEKLCKWIVLIDESVGIGQNRLLVIAGIEEGQLKGMKESFKPLSLRLFYIASAKSWTADKIAMALDKGVPKDSICYVVSDKGSNILKALAIRQVTHVADCTHALAQIVGHIYAKDGQYIAYTACLNLIRQQWILSAQAALVPPQQRSKSRFLNLRELSGYGMKILQNAPMLLQESDQASTLIKKIEAFRPLIEQMDIISRITDKVLKYLKNRGMDKFMCQRLIEKLSTLKAGDKVQLFCEKLTQYLQYLLEKAIDRDYLYCSSDVLESWFGKYKSLCNNQPAAGITDSVLSMAAFGKQPGLELIKQALAQIKMKDINLWKQENTTETLQSMRKRIFKNGTKKCG